MQARQVSDHACAHNDVIIFTTFSATTLTRYNKTWYNNINIIVNRFPLDVQSKCDVRIRLFTANVVQLISFRRETDQVPFAILYKLFRIGFVAFLNNIEFKPIISP